MTIALVTGASSGIGEAFAERLARDGHDVIVTARRADRLEALAGRLHAEQGVRVEAVPADLGKPQDLKMLEERSADVDLLVNNAGFGGYKPFLELDPDVGEALINVHIMATVRLSHAALPGMVRRGAGAIVNVASMLAFSGSIATGPLPKRATYAAAKSFVVTFTQLLAGELEGTGVRAMVCCPGVVATEFHTVQGMDFSHMPRMSSEDIVTAAMAGLEAGEVVCLPTVEDVSLFEDVSAAQRALFERPREAGADPTKIASRYRES